MDWFVITIRIGWVRYIRAVGKQKARFYLRFEKGVVLVFLSGGDRGPFSLFCFVQKGPIEWLWGKTGGMMGAPKGTFTQSKKHPLAEGEGGAASSQPGAFLTR